MSSCAVVVVVCLRGAQRKTMTSVIKPGLDSIQCCFATTLNTIYYISWLHSLNIPCWLSSVLVANHVFTSPFYSKLWLELQWQLFRGFLTLQQMAVWITLSAQASLLFLHGHGDSDATSHLCRKHKTHVFLSLKSQSFVQIQMLIKHELWAGHK